MSKIIIKGYMRVAECDVDVVTAALDYHRAKCLQSPGCLLFEIYPSQQDRQVFNFHYEFADNDAFEHYQTTLNRSAWQALTQGAEVVIEKDGEP